MEEDRGQQPADSWAWRKEALAAVGVVGLWEWDHARETARYCPGAAGLLAGDPNMAWRDLPPGEALAGLQADDAARLHTRMGDAAGTDGVWVDECRVRIAGDGARRVLCRGRTYRGADGAPTRTLGIVIDITDGEGEAGHGQDERAALDRAAVHGMAAHDAIRESGASGLLAPARALLMAIGRELARRMRRQPDSPH